MWWAFDLILGFFAIAVALPLIFWSGILVWVVVWWVLNELSIYIERKLRK